MKLIRQTLLHFQQGSSDKVYEVDLCEVGSGRFVVNYRYGRRGAHLKEGSQTVAPVALGEAQKVFDELVAGKIRKGYSDAVQAPAQPATAQQAATAPAPGTANTPAAAIGDPRERAVLVRLSRAVQELGRRATGGGAAAGATNRGSAATVARGARVTAGGQNRPTPPEDAWPVERAVWRAGELGLRSAAVYLTQLAFTGTPLRDYCIAWALGRCGDSKAGATLARLRDGSQKESVRRIAGEAGRLLADEAGKALLSQQAIDALPIELRGAARNGPAGVLLALVEDYLLLSPVLAPPAPVDATGAGAPSSAQAKPKLSKKAARAAQRAKAPALPRLEPRRAAVIELLYAIDNEHTRPALLHIARTAPLAPPYFQRLRHLYKAAEYRRDGELFGILAHRFEKTPAQFGPIRRYSTTVRLAAGGALRRDDALGRLRDENATLAFGDATRTYLRRRSWRTLRALGTAGDLAYVNLAVGVLLPFTDADAVPVRSGSYYVKRRRVTVTWDEFAPYWAFNHIVRGRSRATTPQKNGKAFRTVEGGAPAGDSARRGAGDGSRGDSSLTSREESFPALWEQRPAGLLHLLSESRCQRVHAFAVRVLSDLPLLLRELDVDTVIMLLGRPYAVTATLGLDLARERYRGGEADSDSALLVALADSMLPGARHQAHSWIDQGRQRFVRDSALMVALCASKHGDTRALAKRLLVSAAFSDETARSLIARIIAHLLSLQGPAGAGIGDPQVRARDVAEQARDIGNLLLESFPKLLRSIGMPILRDLLSHPLPEVQRLGATLLLGHELSAAALPEELLLLLIDSPDEALRGIGIRLFSQLPDEALLLRGGLLLSLCRHPLGDLRASIRPIIRRLAVEHPIFGDRISTGLVEALLLPEPSGAPGSEGVHRDLMRILMEDLHDFTENLPLAKVLALVAGKSRPAQELGGRLLGEHPAWAEGLDTPAIVRLASHEVLAVRQASWALFSRILPRLREKSSEMAAAVRLLDAKWEDSREFAFGVFRESLPSMLGDVFTPGILIGICDSVREDVQRFGRELCTRFFREADGQEYLRKLSEHPSADLQLFATNYLERYAAGDVRKLRELLPYFVSVLSRVNRGRVAKSRIFSFLLQEAEGSEEAARLAAEILTRHSATVAVMDRARAIEGLLRIHQLYPAVTIGLSPLTLRQTAVRDAL